MSKHLDRRRMIISKYSNRPPFDLKKPKECLDIAEKIRCYPEAACKNCCQNRTEVSSYTRTSHKSLNYTSEESIEVKKLHPGTTVIPKIIERFHRISPEPLCDATMSQKTSIQTIYRNTKTCRLGNNLPKHKLMKNLLQGLNSEAEPVSKISASKGKVKYKQSKKMFDKGEVVRPDFSVSFDVKVQSAQEQKAPVCSCHVAQKADKKTSTTGLPWPPNNAREVLHYCSGDCINKNSTQSCRCHKAATSSLDTIKERFQKSKFASESFLEEVPTKDISCKQISPRKSAARFRSHREKTFVRSQVEKLNKVLHTARYPPAASLHARNEGYRKVSSEEQQPERNNYMGMMDKIRNNCPQFHRSSKTSFQQSFETTGSWSEASNECVNPEEIKFPRETKTAVDQRMSEQKRQRIPLSKFTTKVPLACRPAIALSNEENYYEDIKNVPIQKSQEAEPDKKRNTKKRNSIKLGIPCKKNLLCDKGDQHQGPCGYTHNHNKVVY